MKKVFKFSYSDHHLFNLFINQLFCSFISGSISMHILILFKWSVTFQLIYQTIDSFSNYIYWYNSDLYQIWYQIFVMVERFLTTYWEYKIVPLFYQPCFHFKGHHVISPRWFGNEGRRLSSAAVTQENTHNCFSYNTSDAHFKDVGAEPSNSQIVIKGSVHPNDQKN